MKTKPGLDFIAIQQKDVNTLTPAAIGFNWKFSIVLKEAPWRTFNSCITCSSWLDVSGFPDTKQSKNKSFSWMKS